MLSKPDCGWTDVKIGNFSDRASHITDVPIHCLTALISSFKSHQPAAVKFDAEGWEYAVVSDNYATHIISDNCDMGYLYASYNISKSELAKELIRDIEENFKSWVYWEPYSEHMDEATTTVRSNTIRELLNNLKSRC